jgi:hypothetical protein
MSSSDPPKLLTYYSNKINIYDNSSFIQLPDWVNCAPLPQIYLEPEYVYPSPGPYVPPVIVPIMPPFNYPGAYCGNKSTPCVTTSCGPCGR